MSELEGKVAIVTGGTRGIGAAVSLRLAKEGCVVTSVYRSNTSSARTFEKSLRSVSLESSVVQGDVGKLADVKRIVNEAAAKNGKIAILMNNAGIFEFKNLLDMKEAFIDEVFDINFKGQLFMIQEAAPYMKRQGYGRVINASSVSGTTADVGLIGYGSSKAAVEMMTRIAAAELAPFNITVNAYAPGIVHTDLTDEMIRDRGDIQKKQIPAQRFGTCEDVANLVVFLASSAASYITGEIIGIDGGMLKVQNPVRAYE